MKAVRIPLDSAVSTTSGFLGVSKRKLASELLIDATEVCWEKAGLTEAMKIKRALNAQAGLLKS